VTWWGVGALAVSTVGSVYQGSQAEKAGEASAAGSAAAQAQNAQQFEQTQLQNLLLNAPTINSGNIARSELMGILGLDSPGVDYGQYAGLVGGGGGGLGGAHNAEGSPYRGGAFGDYDLGNTALDLSTGDYKQDSPDYVGMFLRQGKLDELVEANGNGTNYTDKNKLLREVINPFFKSIGVDDPNLTTQSGLLGLLYENAGQWESLQKEHKISLGEIPRETAGATSGAIEKFSGGARSPMGQAFNALQAPGSTAIDPSRLQDRLMATPGLAFAIDQATQNTMGQGRAMGLGESGATAKAVGDRVGQGLLFPAYQDYTNRLERLAGMAGQTSSNLAANMGTASQNFGVNSGNLMQQAADSRASGIVGKAGAYGNIANNISGFMGNFGAKKKEDNADPWSGWSQNPTRDDPNYNWGAAPPGTYK
jgi:hypothetical protein